MSNRGEPDDRVRLYTTREAAELLNVSYDWLQRRVAAKEVPHTRLGKFVRFSTKHLQMIIERGERLPEQERGRVRPRSKL